MTEKEIEKLHREWRDCQRRMRDVDVDFQDYQAAFDRGREIEKLMRDRTADQTSKTLEK